MRYLQALKLLIFISVFSYPSITYSSERIGNIIIEGNDKTKQRVILQEMSIRQGDLVDIEQIKKSVQFVMNLNLFEKVRYRLEKHEPSELVDLIITVKERYYLIVLPSAKNG